MKIYLLNPLETTLNNKLFKFLTTTLLAFIKKNSKGRARPELSDLVPVIIL